MPKVTRSTSGGGNPFGADIGTGEIADDSVTYAKIQNVTATDKVLGRSTAGAGDVEEIACTAAGRALLDDADAATQRVTLGAEMLGLFGDASDGDKTVVGTETLTADKFYDDLTVPAGTVLQPDGFRIFVRGTLTLAGTIRSNGNAAAGAAAGAVTADNTLGGGGAGGAGTTGNGNAAPTTDDASSFGGSGGNGGAAGANTGGAGGAVAVPASSASWAFLRVTTQLPSTSQDGGLGGGGGAGDTLNSGGGGGGGGAFIYIRARSLVLQAGHVIEAKGGAGAAGVAGNTGGGGGGGGGCINLHYNQKSGVALSTSVTGGAAGAASGTGAAGVAGSVGRVIEVANT